MTNGTTERHDSGNADLVRSTLSPSPPINKKRRHRSIYNKTCSVSSDASDGTLTDVSHKISSPALIPTVFSFFPMKSTASSFPLPPPIPGGFNDPTTADVLLRLYSEKTFNSEIADFELQLYVHSSLLLRRTKYFAALFSDRWIGDHASEGSPHRKLNLAVAPGTGSLHEHALVIQLIYTDDFATAINSVSSALSVLPIALKLLFEDCVKECVRYLESVQWSEEEEERIMDIIPLLGEEESNELLARVSPPTSDVSEGMLDILITKALNSLTNVDKARDMVESLLREFPSRSVLNRKFSNCLKAAKLLLDDYSEIKYWNLDRAVTQCMNSMWLIDRLIELRAADLAVREWSEQASLAANFKRLIGGYHPWRIKSPELPIMVFNCISKVVDLVANGTVLAPAKVRNQLVANWLPVLIVCNQTSLPFTDIDSSTLNYSGSLQQAFLKIISTLPIADAKDLLIHCFSFCTSGDPQSCCHLFQAYQTWFRRATTASPLGLPPSDSFNH